MHLVCLDLEGVLVPEIWISFAEATGIDELKLTTRDVPDYDVLMKGRIMILNKNHLLLRDIQHVIEGMEPLPGATEFLKDLRSIGQVIILSDTFAEFARPLMIKLGDPTLFCNSLEIDAHGSVVGYKLRIKDGKRKSVEALAAAGFDVIAAGDSYNDINMLGAASKGILFRPPRAIIDKFSEFPVAESHHELFEMIRTSVLRLAGKPGA